MGMFDKEKNDKRNVGLYIDSILADRCRAVAERYGITFNKALVILVRTGLEQAEKEMRDKS